MTSDSPLQWAIDTGSIARAPVHFRYEASKEELRALQDYAALHDLPSLKAEVKVTPLGAGKFRVSGKLSANIVQSSVVDLSAVSSAIDETFSIDYWPEDSIERRESETVLLDNDPPEPLINGRIPIGQLLAEILAVSMDPYPRNGEDKFEWQPPMAEPQTSPFEGLTRFRPKKPSGEN
ncbi:MAG: hypothetical protein WBX25_26945 [Rhodomicrobium sp.]